MYDTLGNFVLLQNRLHYTQKPYLLQKLQNLDTCKKIEVCDTRKQTQKSLTYYLENKSNRYFITSLIVRNRIFYIPHTRKSLLLQKSVHRQ